MEPTLSYMMVVEEDRTSFLLKGQGVIESIELVEEDLLGLVRSGKPRIIIDLSEVTFVDVSFLNMLMKVHHQMFGYRTEPVIVMGDSPIIANFDRNGILKLFPIFRTFDEARTYLASVPA